VKTIRSKRIARFNTDTGLSGAACSVAVYGHWNQNW
jgi:hypothetical protein